MSEISIIIPIYNVEKYLRRCLDSVKNQTFQDWTAICVDDGSPDKSGSIADEYAKKDKRFIVVHKKNGGVSDARNAGLKKVKSEYVMFLDGDDFIHPQTMEIVHNMAEKNKVDVVSFKMFHGDVNQEKLELFKKKHEVKRIKNKTINNILLWTTSKDKGVGSWYVQQSIVCIHLYRFDFIKSIKFPKNIKVCEDFVFWSNVLFKKPRTCIIKTPLYYYTINPNSALHTVDYAKSSLNLISAIKLSYNDMCAQKVSRIDQRRWKSRFMWHFLSRAYSYATKIEDKKSLKKVCNSLIDLQKSGALDNTPDLHALRYKHRIERFISQIS